MTYEAPQKSLSVTEALHKVLGISPAAVPTELPSPESVKATAPAGKLGSCVFLPVSGGAYLLERNSADAEHNPGKLRPPGGGKNAGDENLTDTMLRELREEFGISVRDSRPKLQQLGYQVEGPFRGSACFLLPDHGLSPGTYQASNAKHEQVTLEIAHLTDADYVGPQLASLSPTPPANSKIAAVLRRLAQA